MSRRTSALLKPSSIPTRTSGNFLLSAITAFGMSVVADVIGCRSEPRR